MKRNLSVLVIAAIAGSIAAGAMQSLLSAFAVQNELVPPTSGIFTGVQYSQKLGDAFRSLASCNKGATAPANVNGSAVDGLCWIDDSGSPWVVKQYVNGDWAVTGYLDPTNSSYAGIVGGGLGSIAAASTTDLGSVAQATVSITGDDDDQWLRRQRAGWVDQVRAVRQRLEAGELDRAGRAGRL
ncbi:hypothetical protein ABIF50_005884 [Bradyrhizobium diazoefficiens]